MRPIRSPLIASAVNSAPNAGSEARRKPAAPLASFPTGRNLGMTAQPPLRAARRKSTGENEPFTEPLRGGYRFRRDALLLRLPLVDVALRLSERREEPKEGRDADRQ